MKAAAKQAGISASAAQWRRNRNADFATRWQQALLAGNPKKKGPSDLRRSTNWRSIFIEALAETSNVSASAAQANTPLRTVYKLRREDPEFRARWQSALCEGYDNLEMELLGHLRHPDAGRKMDVTAALRLLVAHRETVARERALREDDDEQAVLDSIDRFIDGIRERRAANAAILIEAEAEPDEVGPDEVEPGEVEPGDGA